VKTGSGPRMTAIEWADRLPSAVRGRLSATLVMVAVICAGMVLSACSSSTVGTKEAYGEEEPPGTIYNTGLAYMNAGSLKNAIKSFDEVDRQHPYSDWARKSLIMSAYASYKIGDFNGTIQSANRYLSLYPGSEEAPYAEFLIAQSNFNQMSDVTRDQSSTLKALEGMQGIVDRYPDSEYANDARRKVVQTRDQLAAKELQIGRYYLERREYIAAINRFKTVVKDYSDTRLVEEALYRLVEANLAMGLVGDAQAAGGVLGHNYPNSEWYELAYKRLGAGGVEPEADSGSWLSRVFGNNNPT
jgi:outer membrane protein assembly factor BamD